MTATPIRPCPQCGCQAASGTGFAPSPTALRVWCTNINCALSPEGHATRVFTVDEWHSGELAGTCDA